VPWSFSGKSDDKGTPPRGINLHPCAKDQSLGGVFTCYQLFPLTTTISQATVSESQADTGPYSAP
jgi:hypothetical protein